MKRLKSVFLPLVLLALGLCSCEVIHEFPQPGKEVDPTDVQSKIEVRCAIELAGMDIVTKSPFSPVFEDDASQYDRRFIVNIYSNEYSDELVDSHVIYRDALDVSDPVVETKLHTKKYKLVVWMDYVKKGSGTDFYYFTADGQALNAIHQPDAENYVACSDFKDARTFTTDIDLTPFAGQWYADITVPAPLERPISKITVLTNDLAEYAAKIGYEGPLSDLAGDIVLEFSYDGYFPTGFNAYTGRLNDSQTGYGFKTYASYPFTLEGKDYTRIGFDYVFINGDSSSVTITVKISSKSGQFINEVNNVVIPIIKNRETVLIYKFLTKEYVPGIGIDPGFDGEFTIYV